MCCEANPTDLVVAGTCIHLQLLVQVPAVSAHPLAVVEPAHLPRQRQHCSTERVLLQM